MMLKTKLILIALIIFGYSFSEIITGDIIVKYRTTSGVSAFSLGAGNAVILSDRHPNHPLKLKSEKPLLTRQVSSFQVMAGQGKRHPLEGVQKIQLADGEDTQAAIDWLNQQPDIEYAVPNIKMQAFDTVPSDNAYISNQQTNLRAENLEKAWDVSTGAVSIMIAVIDTGVDYTHPELTGNRIVKGHDYVNNDNDPMDDAGHGTHVAGIIGAKANNNDVTPSMAGIDWNCKLLAIKVLDSTGHGSLDNIVAGIYEAVDSGSKVINLSLGAISGPNSYDGIFMQAAIDYAYQNNVIVVAAAGNEAHNMSLPTYKVSPVCNDGSLNEVIGVASVGTGFLLSSFSNYSDQFVDISAIGENVYSTVTNNAYKTMNGTSMATPMISGIIGLLVAKMPTISVTHVQDFLSSGAINIDSLNGGYPARSLGSGLVDAFRSLSYLVSLPTTNVGTSTITRFYNYPNPIDSAILKAGSTSFHLECSSVPSQVELVIYSVSGKRVRKFAFSPSVFITSIGDDIAIWDLKDETGNYLPPGLYFGVVTVVDPTGQRSQSVKKVLLK